MGGRIESKSSGSDILLSSVLEYESPASRVRGFQELFRYDLRAPEPMLILGDSAFRHWLDREMDERLREIVGTAFDQIRTENSNRGAYVGRAFFVPGIDNPNGPRTAGIWDKETYIDEVEKFWQFVVDPENNYNVEGADIALVLHPFINVMDPRPRYGEIELKEEELPWSGGYVVPAGVPGREQQVKIVVTFGPDEAVQSCPSDTMLVDPERGIVPEKDIVLKTHTFVPTGEGDYKEIELPIRWQEEQALTDEEAILVARMARKVFSQRDDVRLEFIMQPEGVYVREIALWKEEDERALFRFKEGEEMVGEVVRVEDIADVVRVRGPEVIVYFPAEVFRRRTTDLFAQVANMKGIERMVALAYGTGVTSHMTRVLGEAGRSVILLGDEDLLDGAPVKISCGSDGTPMVEYLDPYYGAVVDFDDVGRLMDDVAGKKVARLARMRQAGLSVPDGFGVTSAAVWQWLMEIGVYEQISKLDTLPLDNRAEIERITEEIKDKILATRLPEGLEEKIMDGLIRHGFDRWSIRSSGNEDQEKQSLAGLYESPLPVDVNKVTQELRRTIASYFSLASIVILRQSDLLPSQMTVGLGIHEYISDPPGTIGAVVFTDRSKITIEAKSGSPSDIVKGTARDYIRLEITKRSGQIKLREFGKPEITLPEEVIDQVIGEVRKIEELFQSYQDIELLIQPNARPIFLQARPR